MNALRVAGKPGFEKGSRPVDSSAEIQQMYHHPGNQRSKTKNIMRMRGDLGGLVVLSVILEPLGISYPAPDLGLG